MSKLSVTRCATGRSPRSRISLCLVSAGLILFLPCPGNTASGRVNNNGTIDVTLNFRFPPTAANLQTARDQVTAASRILWDASEGQLRFGNVTLTCGAVNEDLADMWVWPQPGRAGVTYNVDGSGLQVLGRHVDQFLPSSDGTVIAHEFGHLALGLGDEYSEQNRFGECWGFGQCIENGALSEQNQCLMQQPGGFTQTEFCTTGRHDVVVGNNTSCLVNPPNANGAPCATNCRFWNTTTLRYETSQQTDNVNRSCWAHIKANFPWINEPAGLPVAAEPGGFVAPNFINNCSATNTVLLLLDRSGSMAWNVSNDLGEVCGDGVDNDGDGLIDEASDCGMSRMSFVKAAARAYLDLANGQGVRAAIVSFANTATAAANFTAVTGSTIGLLRAKVDSLTPGGCTAIGDALTYSKALFDLDTVPEDNKTVFLLTDGFNTCGSDPAAAVPALRGIGVRVFTIPTGDAANDPSLSSISGATGGARVEAKDGTALVNAFVQQWARYTNSGVIIPRLKYKVDRKSNFEENIDYVRDPKWWSSGQLDPRPAPGGVYARDNKIRFIIEKGTEKASLVLAGDMRDMSGFGVQAVLLAPGGAVYDSEAPRANMRVVRDGFYVLLEISGPEPGEWMLDITPGPGAADIQTGSITLISDNPLAELFVDLNKHIVTTPGEPVTLTMTPSYSTALHGIPEWDVTVIRPDGYTYNVPVAEGPIEGSYTAVIAGTGWRGQYEVRVRMRTGTTTMNDPGESIYAPEPDNAVPVPDFERCAAVSFVVQSGEPSCQPGPNQNYSDCDLDGVPNTVDNPGVDTDKDGIPDGFDHDSDNDEIPDAVEYRNGRDLDGDGSLDFLDPDADGDGIFDANDPAIALPVRGDLDGDGRVTFTDVLDCLRLAGGLQTLSAAGLTFADVVPDGSVNLLDALGVYRLMGGVLGGSVYVLATNRYNTYGVYVDRADLDDNPLANLVPCHRYIANYNSVLGVYYEPASRRWVVYNEDLSPMAVGEQINIATGPRVQRMTRGAGTNGIGHAVRLDSPLLNGVAGAIPLATHEFVAALNLGPLGLWWDGFSSWYAFNEALWPMADGERFHFLDARSDGGKVVVGPGTAFSTYGVYINDPRINGKPNAVVLAQHAFQAQYHIAPVGVWYDAAAGLWVAYNENPAVSMVNGEVIHYLIVP